VSLNVEEVRFLDRDSSKKSLSAGSYKEVAP